MNPAVIVIGIVVGIAIVWFIAQRVQSDDQRDLLRRMANQVHYDQLPMERGIAEQVGAWREDGPAFGVWVRPREQEAGTGRIFVDAYTSAEAAATAASAVRATLLALAEGREPTIPT